MKGGVGVAHVWSPTFIIGTIHIGQVEGASCVSFGNNWISEFTSFKKQNQGFGSVHGDHAVLHSMRSLVHDPDTIDSAIPPTEWVRKERLSVSPRP